MPNPLSLRSDPLAFLLALASAIAVPLPSSPLAAQAAVVAAPVAFVPNLGQWADAAAYRCVLPAVTVFVTNAGWTARFADGEGGVAVVMRFVGADVAAIVPEQRLAGVHHYFLGNEPADWRTNVPLYAAVRQCGVYAGVDVLCHSRGRAFEYDVVLAPGARLDAVVIDVAGVDRLQVDADGAMLLTTGRRTIRQTAPVGFVVTGDGNRPVATAFELRGERRFGFRVPDWDGAQTLVIFDDAVMHQRDRFAAHVRMRVAYRRHAVRRPPRMGDTEPTGMGFGPQRFLEHAYLARHPHALNGLVLDGRDAGRIIAAIFQSLQTFDQDGRNIALRDSSDYSTHLRCISVLKKLMSGLLATRGARRMRLPRQAQLVGNPLTCLHGLVWRNRVLHRFQVHARAPVALTGGLE